MATDNYCAICRANTARSSLQILLEDAGAYGRSRIAFSTKAHHPKDTQEDKKSHRGYAGCHTVQSVDESGIKPP